MLLSLYYNICTRFFHGNDTPLLRLDNIIIRNSYIAVQTHVWRVHRNWPSIITIALHILLQVIKMLVAVVIVFIICWAPILINNILVAFAVLPELSIPPYKYMREAFHLMSYANSCVNPIVYGFMSRNFRQTFKRALCSCLRGRQYVRKLTFKNQSAVVEKWNGATGTRHSELVSTCTDIYEMREVNDKSSSDSVTKV